MEKIGHVLMQIELARNNKIAACVYLPEATTVEASTKEASAWLAAVADADFNKVAELLLPTVDGVLFKEGFIPSPSTQQGEQDPSQGGPSQQGGQPDPAQGMDPAAQQQQAAQQLPPQGADGRGTQQPTDLDKTTVTLSLRDVIDLTSNGKATQSALKIQDAINKQQMKAEQMQRQQAMKEQQDQQKNQMGGQGGGMMDSGGIYGQQPQQGEQPQQGGQPQQGMM